MDTPDNTVILRMKKDFRTFLSGGSRPSMDGSAPALCPLSFNVSDLQGGLDTSKADSQCQSSSKLRSSVSMKSLLEKSQEAKKVESQLIQAKTELTNMNSKYHSLETSRKRARIEYESSLENITQEQKRDHDKMMELQQKLHQIKMKEEDTNVKLRECQKQMASTKNLYETKLTSVQREKFELASRLDELEQLSRNQVFQLNQEKMRQDMEMKICQSELEETKQQLAASQRRCAETQKLLQELEEYKLKAMNSDLHVKELETSISRMDTDAVVTKAMKSQLSRVPELVKENRRLLEDNSYCKNTQENILLLKEELESCKQRLQREQARARQASTLELRCEELEKKLQSWESCDITNSKSPQSPALLKRHMSELQRSNLLIMEKQGQLQTSAHRAEYLLQSKQTELATVQEQRALEKQRFAQQTEFIKRLQRKLLLISKERDVYKDMTDSEMSSMKMGAASNVDQVHQLEETLQGYRRQLAQLESQLDASSSHLSEARARCSLLESQVRSQGQELPPVTSKVDQKIITQLRTQVAELEKELEQMTEKHDILAARIEQRHLQGDYDPTKVKVLHMPMNPGAILQKQRAEEVARLRKENEALSQRVKLLEEGGGAVEDLTVKVQQKLEQPGTSDDIEGMRAQITKAELKKKRLIEAFMKKSQEFREVCFQLLGYKIDIPTDNQYRLMSIYAESPEEYLLFQQNSDGLVEMLSTEYATTLEDKIEAYLQQANSIPAFLSSITMMLYSRQTMCQSTTSFS